MQILEKRPQRRTLLLKLDLSVLIRPIPGETFFDMARG